MLLTFLEILKFAKVFISTFVFFPNFFNLLWLNIAAVFFKKLKFLEIYGFRKKIKRGWSLLNVVDHTLPPSSVQEIVAAQACGG